MRRTLPLLLLLTACTLEARCDAPDVETDVDRKLEADREIMKIKNEAEMFKLRERGKCPLTVSDFDGAPRSDPWGTTYRIACPGEHGMVDVISAGPDREWKTEDDVTSFDDELESEAAANAIREANR